MSLIRFSHCFDSQAASIHATDDTDHWCIFSRRGPYNTTPGTWAGGKNTFRVSSEDRRQLFGWTTNFAFTSKTEINTPVSDNR